MSLKRTSLYSIILCIVQLLLILSLSGCAGQEAESKDTSAKQVESEKYNLALEEWADYQQVEEPDSQWVVTEYLEDFWEISEPDMERGEGFCAADADTCYSIQQYYTANNEAINYTYYFCSLDTVTLEADTIKLDFATATVQDLAQKVGAGYARVCAVDAVGEEVRAFLEVWDEERRMTNCYAVGINDDGIVSDVVDFSAVIQENCEVQQDGALNLSAVCGIDEYYFIDREKQQIIVADSEGALQSVIELQGCTGATLDVTCKSPDGIPIFEYEDTDNQTVVFSLSGTDKKILYTGESEKAATRSIDEYGNVICLSGGQLLSWNASKGQCRNLYDIKGLTSLECRKIMKNSAGEVALLFDDKSKPYLYKLKADEGFVQTEIELLQLFNDEYTKTCAAEYSRKHPGVLITVSQVQSDDTVINRTVEEMKSGEGPDMLVLNRRQLMDLREADCLADLSEVLSEELRAQIFHGVLQYGTIGEGLYGIPYEAGIGTLIVADNTWKEETWTIQDVIDLLEQKKKEGALPERFESISHSAGADQLLYDICLQSIQNSNFLNMQQKTCDFETEEFYSLLRLCKELAEEEGSMDYLPNSERQEELISGKALTYPISGGLINFSQDRAAFGDDFHCVGYPTNSGNRGVVECYRCVAVSRWTENYDVIKDFMEFLLSEENQIQHTTNWVRRDVILEHVHEHTQLGDAPVFLMEGKKYIELAGKPDGSSFAEEYIALMDTGEPLSTEYVIQDIILEEAGAYFAGDKTEQEAAGIIQSRVKLYLEERK